MNQPHTYIYPFPSGFPFRSGHHSALSRVFFAIRYALVSYLFHMWSQQCTHVDLEKWCRWSYLKAVLESSYMDTKGKDRGTQGRGIGRWDCSINKLYINSTESENKTKAWIERQYQYQFNHSLVSDSLWPHGLQHSRFPYPQPAPRAYSNKYPSSQWCHSIISSCYPLLLLPSIFPSIRIFSNESALHIKWPKYWSFSFSISPSNEYSRLISFRMDWLDLLAVQGTLTPTPQFKSINSLVLIFLYSPTLTSIHDYWKNHSFD